MQHASNFARMKRLLLLICWAKIGKITTTINESDIKKKVKQNSMFTVKFFVLFLFFVFCFVVVVFVFVKKSGIGHDKRRTSFLQP